MVGKVFGLILATVIIIGGLIMFWPALQSGIATNNTTWAAANYTATQQAIRFTPLGIWVAFLALPAVGIIVLIYARRQGVV